MSARVSAESASGMDFDGVGEGAAVVGASGVVADGADAIVVGVATDDAAGAGVSIRLNQAATPTTAATAKAAVRNSGKNRARRGDRGSLVRKTGGS